MTKKKCKKCGRRKILDDFPKQKQNLDGRLGTCRLCKQPKNREASLKCYHKGQATRKIASAIRKAIPKEKRKAWDKKYRETHKQEIIDQKTRYNCRVLYNISIETYQERMDSSDVCELCGSDKMLGYDHDHHTLEFRGVLCKKCNGGLGMLGDNIETIEKVLAYLNKSKCPTTSPLQDVGSSESKRVGS